MFDQNIVYILHLFANAKYLLLNKFHVSVRVDIYKVSIS